MLGPGIGGFEVVVVALVALIVVGPKDLPLLMRKVGEFLGRARKMAAEFRQSFDDMARQSELDDLRREVEALRQGQILPVDKETKAALTDIKKELYTPPAPPPGKPTAIEQTPPMTEPTLSEAETQPEQAAEPTPKRRAPRKRKAPE